MYSRILIKFGKGQALIYTNQTELQAFFTTYCRIFADKQKTGALICFGF